MSHHIAPAAKAKRVRFAPLAIATGVAAAVLLSVSMSGTLSGFVASITNSNNTAASGTLVMQETQTGAGANPATTTCLSTDATGGVSNNAATCATINKFGGSTTMIPGQTVTSVVNLKNVGTSNAATFTLTPGACTQVKNGTVNGSATDFCSKLNVVITAAGNSTPVYSGTAAGLTTVKTLSALAAGASADYTFAVTLDSSAGNTYQGLGATMPLTWTFAS